MDQETKKLVESLKGDDVFRNFVADFTERMLKHLNWEVEDGAHELQGRLNDATAELSKFASLFVQGRWE